MGYAPLVGHYDYRLVALSVFIAILASYAALDLTDRIVTVSGLKRFAWLSGGAFSMGIGIWAMHYVGMAALRLPVPVLYDWPTVLLSAFASIVASGVALYVVARSTMGRAATILGSIFMGGGIAAMHYIGMAAMRLPAMCRYSPWLVTLSVVLAIAIAYLALRLLFAFRLQTTSWGRRRFSSAILLGVAISVMHYVGMAAVTFAPGSMTASLRHAAHLSTLGLARIIVLTLFLLTLVIVVSIIDRRLARQMQDIAEKGLQLQAIFDNITDGIAVVDLQKNTVQANPAAVALLGLPASKAFNEEFRNNFEIESSGGQFLPREEWPFSLALRGIFLQNRELTISRKDTGHRFVAEMSTTPIRNAAGEMVQIIVTHRDVSERHQNTDTRARLAAIVDSSEDAIVGKDDKGIVRSWNAAAERIFGYTAEEMIGESILRLLPAGQEQEEYEFLNRIKRGEVIDHVETMRKTKSGKLIHVSLTISPIRDSQGKVVGASKMARDISDRKQLERQLQQSQKMEAIGQLTGGIAHDFNNLLGVIVGNLGLIELQVPGREKTLKHVYTAQKAAWRGADLVRRLLAFSSDDGLKPTATSLTETIQNFIELASRAIGPEIAIQTRLDDSIPPIFVDPAGLESALLNLAVNARDSMPKGGVLTVASELRSLDDKYPPVATGELKRGVHACLSVTDTGSGMSQETLARVFEPFFTTKPRGKGTGLGLAMVYGFARQSNGAVRIYSELGYGTTVSMYFPLAEEFSAAQPVATVAGYSKAEVGSTVLIIDDDLDLLEIASAYLTGMGFLCLEAVDGISALEVVSNTKGIDLVVTDVIMPGGMNGVELLQRIRELIPDVKVIYSSGFSADALAERNGTLVDGVLLRKPYQRAEFESAVHYAMGSRKT